MGPTYGRFLADSENLWGVWVDEWLANEVGGCNVQEKLQRSIEAENHIGRGKE